MVKLKQQNQQNRTRIWQPHRDRPTWNRPAYPDPRPASSPVTTGRWDPGAA